MPHVLQRLIGVVLMLLSVAAAAQNVDPTPMSKGGNLTQNICPGRRDVITSVPGIHLINEHFVSSAQVVSAMSIEMRVSVRICDPTSQVIIYDGNDATAPVLASYSFSNAMYGADYYVYPSSGSVYIYYETSGGEECEDVFRIESSATDLHADAANETDHSAVIAWDDETNNAWTIYYGTSPNNLDHSVEADHQPFTLTGLSAFQRYYYRVVPRPNTVQVPAECPVSQLTTSCLHQLLPSAVWYDANSISFAIDEENCSEWSVHYGDEVLDHEYHTDSLPLRLEGLTEESDYFYRIFCGNVGLGEVNPACPVLVVRTQPIPTHAEAIDCHSVQIYWEDSVHSTWWLTYGNPNEPTRSLMVTESPFRLQELSENTEYWYTISSINNDSNERSNVNMSTFRTPCCFSMTDVSQGSSSIQFSWEPLGESPWVVYLHMPNGTIVAADTVDEPHVTITGLVSGTIYSVYAVSLGSPVTYNPSCWRLVSTICDNTVRVNAIDPHAVELNWDDRESDCYYIFCGDRPTTMELRATVPASPYVMRGLPDGQHFSLLISASPQPPTAVAARCATEFSTPCLNPRVVSSFENGILLDWDDDVHNRWVIRYGTSRTHLDQKIYTSHHPFRLAGLPEGTTVYYHVSYLDSTLAPNNQCVRSYTPPCNPFARQCVEYDHIYGCHTKAYISRQRNQPFLTPSVENHGQFSPNSFHTVVTSRTFDIRCTNPGDTLWTIPRGETSVVRLGSWSPTPDMWAGGIRYQYHVDANVNNLLILKYAVAAEYIGHNSADAPSFRLEIKDEYGRLINPQCYSTLLIPVNPDDPSWRRGTGLYLWRDWTSLAIDLTPLDGRNILIELSVQNCNTATHAVYAYYTLKCGNSNIRTSTCGDNVSTTFRVAEGFRYEWFRDDAPSDILSTVDSLHVDVPGIYHCRMSFTGQDATAQCQFTSTAVASTRYPMADFAVEETDSSDCIMRYRFVNHSRITLDADHARPIDQPCEQYEWIVDDRDHYNSIDLALTLPTLRTHKVQLVARLADGLCTDTMTRFVYHDDLCPPDIDRYDTICEGDTLLFHGQPLTVAGTYDHGTAPVEHLHLVVRSSVETFRSVESCDSIWLNGHVYRSSQQLRIPLTDNHGCDSFDIVSLTIHPTVDLLLLDTCVENALPRRVEGVTFSHAVADSVLLVPTESGCDSRLHYSLHVWPNVVVHIDTTICRHDLPFRWQSLTFRDAGTQSFRFAAMESHGADSTVHLTVHVVDDTHRYFHDVLYVWELPHYFFGRLYYGAVDDDTLVIPRANGCDSVFHYTLRVIDSTRFPDCGLRLQFPNFVSANGDNYNDRFVIVNLLEENCFSHTLLVIYNRWGAEMYRVNDIRQMDDFWSPAEHNAPTGTYFYHFKGSSPKGSVERNGVIEVIR